MERLVMMNKSFIVLFFFVISCGKNVNISNQKLQSNSPLSISSLQEGVLIRGKPDKIKMSSVLYTISVYSSYNALEFVASKKLDSQIDVKFKGKIKNSEIILETIQAK